jgi:hypothetical protein
MKRKEFEKMVERNPFLLTCFIESHKIHGRTFLPPNFEGEGELALEWAYRFTATISKVEFHNSILKKKASDESWDLPNLQINSSRIAKAFKFVRLYFFGHRDIGSEVTQIPCSVMFHISSRGRTPRMCAVGSIVDFHDFGKDYIHDILVIATEIGITGLNPHLTWTIVTLPPNPILVPKPMR